MAPDRVLLYIPAVLSRLEQEQKKLADTSHVPCADRARPVNVKMVGGGSKTQASSLLPLKLIYTDGNSNLHVVK